MKTILHVIDTTGPGGAETMFIELADRLREKGYRSVVVIQGEGWVHDQLCSRGLEPIIIPAKGSFNFSLLFALLRLVRKQKIDVIQSHLLGSNIYCALVAMIARVPVVATFHGMVDVAEDERVPWLKYKILNWGVSRFVSVSRGLQDAIDRQGLLNADKTTVVYNGIDLLRYRKGQGRALREQLKLADDCVIVGALGNVRPAKDYATLVKAAARVVAVCPQAQFIVAGDKKPSLMGDLEALLQQEQLHRHVHFIGFIADSADYLSQLDIFALSSSSEGFSLSTIEAMATGLPVVTTRCGGPEEIVCPDSDALMVGVNDPEALAGAIIRLINDPELAQRLQGAAVDSVHRRFSIEQTVSSYIDLYETV